MSDASIATTCTCKVCDGCRAAMNDFLCEVLCEAQSACADIGATVKFVIRGESDITRDDFQSMKKLKPAAAATYSICAMNIQHQPDRHRLERAGLVLPAEVLIFTPTKAWIDLTVDYRDIDIRRTTVTLGVQQYRIKEKSRAQVVVDIVPLYYTFGLVQE